MMDYVEEFPSKIPVISYVGGRELISYVNVRYQSVLPKCLICWCFGHCKERCSSSTMSATTISTIGQMMARASKLVRELSVESRRKKKLKRKNRKKKKSSL